LSGVIRSSKEGMLAKELVGFTVDGTQVVNGKYDETSRGHIRVKVPAIELMFLSSSMGSRVTGRIVGSITLGCITMMGCNGYTDEVVMLVSMLVMAISARRRDSSSRWSWRGYVPRF